MFAAFFNLGISLRRFLIIILYIDIRSDSMTNLHCLDLFICFPHFSPSFLKYFYCKVRTLDFELYWHRKSRKVGSCDLSTSNRFLQPLILRKIKRKCQLTHSTSNYSGATKNINVFIMTSTVHISLSIL